MRLDHDLLANTLLLKSPGWVQVGLAAPNSRLRDEAAQELARVIIEETFGECPADDPAQLRLAVRCVPADD